MNRESSPSSDQGRERMRRLGLKCLFALSLLATMGATPNRKELLRQALTGEMPSPDQIERIVSLTDVGKPSRRMGRAAAQIMRELKGVKSERQLGESDVEELVV